MTTCCCLLQRRRLQERSLFPPPLDSAERMVHPKREDTDWCNEWGCIRLAFCSPPISLGNRGYGVSGFNHGSLCSCSPAYSKFSSSPQMILLPVWTSTRERWYFPFQPVYIHTHTIGREASKTHACRRKGGASSLQAVCGRRKCLGNKVLSDLTYTNRWVHWWKAETMSGRTMENLIRVNIEFGSVCRPLATKWETQQQINFRAQEGLLPVLGSLEVNRIQGLLRARQFLEQLSCIPRPKSLALVNQLALGENLLTIFPLHGILFLKPTLAPRQESSIVTS